MSTCFLTTLLQTQLRNSEHFSQTSKKPGSKAQTYAAVTADRLPIRHKPKSIPALQPMKETKYPCAKCIVTATMLTTTEKKYTEKLNIAPRYKTIEAYEETLPKQLRARFVATFKEITQGYPNHQESRGCPFSSHPEKRQQFHKAAPNPPTDITAADRYQAVVESCKAFKLCAKCGRDRTPANEKKHKQCSTHSKTCHLSWTPQCKTDSCNHPEHTTQSIWRSEEFTLQAEEKLLPKQQNPNFH